jgi:transposase-like protein
MADVFYYRATNGGKVLEEHGHTSITPDCPLCKSKATVTIDADSGQIDESGVYDFVTYRCNTCHYIFEERWYQ